MWIANTITGMIIISNVALVENMIWNMCTVLWTLMTVCTLELSNMVHINIGNHITTTLLHMNTIMQIITNTDTSTWTFVMTFAGKYTFVNTIWWYASIMSKHPKFIRSHNYQSTPRMGPRNRGNLPINGRANLQSVMDHILTSIDY